MFSVRGEDQSLSRCAQFDILEKQTGLCEKQFHTGPYSFLMKIYQVNSCGFQLRFAQFRSAAKRFDVRVEQVAAMSGDVSLQTFTDLLD